PGAARSSARCPAGARARGSAWSGGSGTSWRARGAGQNRPPRPAMPPMTWPISRSCSSFAWRCASATAAVTRSSSISTSSGSTTLGSMRTEAIVPSPLATAVTMPAPDEPSTVMPARRSCTSAICLWARCASFISFWMFMSLLGPAAVVGSTVVRPHAEPEAVLSFVIVSLRLALGRIRRCVDAERLVGSGVGLELDHAAGEEALQLGQGGRAGAPGRRSGLVLGRRIAALVVPEAGRQLLVAVVRRWERLLVLGRRGLGRRHRLGRRGAAGGDRRLGRARRRSGGAARRLGRGGPCGTGPLGGALHRPRAIPARGGGLGRRPRLGRGRLPSPPAARRGAARPLELDRVAGTRDARHQLLELLLARQDLLVVEAPALAVLERHAAARLLDLGRLQERLELRGRGHAHGVPRERPALAGAVLRRRCGAGRGSGRRRRVGVLLGRAARLRARPTTRVRARPTTRVRARLGGGVRGGAAPRSRV